LIEGYRFLSLSLKEKKKTLPKKPAYNKKRSRREEGISSEEEFNLSEGA